MLVVQACWLPGRLALWAEDGSLPNFPEMSPETVTLRLPGTAKGPAPSPEAGTEAPTRVSLRSYQIPAQVTPGQAALAALAGFEPEEDWLPAASLRYLQLLAGFACDLARRGRILPQLVLEAGVPTARWRPVITGGDAATYRDFATAMPPVVRAADTGLGRAQAELLSVALTGAAQMTATWWLAADRPIPKAEAVRLLETLQWRGISNFPLQGAG